MPLISVILTSFNHGNFIREAIESVLNQSFHDFELIIWDDASIDNSWEIIESYSDSRIRTFRNPQNKGPVFGVNKAIFEIAQGKYVAIHHSDDVWELNKLQMQLDFLEENTGIGAVFSNARAIDERGAPLTDSTHFYYNVFSQPNRSRYEWLRYFFLTGNALCHPSILIRKQCYVDCGPYLDMLGQVPDFDMWVRLCATHEIHVLPDRLVKFRVRDAEMNTSGSRPMTRILDAYEFYKVLQRYRSIVSVENVFKIFPEFLSYDRGEKTDPEYVLARAGLESESFFLRQLLANEILFEILNNPARRAFIESAYHFSPNDFIAITGAHDLFSCEEVVASQVSMAERDGQIASLNQVLTERDDQIASLNQSVTEREGQIATLTASRSWQLTKPVRFVGRLIRGEFGIAFAPFPRVRRQVATISALCRMVPRAMFFNQGSLRLSIRRVLGVLLREGISGVMRRVKILMDDARSGSRQMQSSIAMYGEVPPPDPGFMPKVSIIVPNFNHAKYLPERLESIYGQTYGNVEVILLDDCSSDESVAILRDYAERYPGKTICRFNAVNSGGVFNQWKKGLELATGELVWIAESDDYCSPNLLEELVRSFRNQAVMLAFARTEFVRGMPPVKAWTSEEYLSDLDLDIWDRPFIRSAHAMVKSGWAVKNVVPNVSGAIFRHPGEMGLLNDSQWLKLRMCGDWVFYLSIIRGGLVAYSPDATNYYRQHTLNTSVNAQKENLYYQEHEIVARYLAKLYRLDRADFEKQEKHLYLHWCGRRGESRLGEFRALYDLDKVWQRTTDRRPNIVMAVYALAAGGGETFPVMLANLLHNKGYAVTLLNCKQQATESGVRRMLLGCIPLLELDRIELADQVFTDMGIELVHSHHASIDVTLATLLLNNQDIKHIVTTHGMYEMMTPEQVQNLMPLLKRGIDRFVYTAEKSLAPFSLAFRKEKYFCKIDNALALTGISPIPRAELQVDTDDFVLCLVARAIPEKGWEEAIDAVAWAHARSSRKVRLLLIGEGPEFERLKSQTSHEFVHFLGFRSNIRDYFATSDIGFLPSRFKGESFPLVLIDCLHSGKPVLASNIGEIRNMLDSGGGLAGELFGLKDWTIPIETVGQIILKLANDPETYQELLRRVPLAAAKFDPGRMVDKYEAVYQGCLAAAESDAVDSTMKIMGGQS